MHRRVHIIRARVVIFQYKLSHYKINSGEAGYLLAFIWVYFPSFHQMRESIHFPAHHNNGEK